MTQSESNARLVRRLYDEHINPGRLDNLDAIVAPDFIGAGDVRGPAAFAASMRGLREALPDLAYTLEDVVASGDRVAIRWTLRGTHTGPFRTFPPTGKRIKSTGVAIFQVADDKLVRAWVENDRLGFFTAIGALPHNPAFGPPPATE